MAAPIIIPEVQFLDADGHPYAGGSLTAYVPGTSTPKTTWLDPDGTAANTQPVILDAAGRCSLWGSGDYRLLLRDAAGNQVFDIEATTLVSAAMAPVIAAPTIPDAVHLLGLDDVVSGSDLSAAITTETNARIAADNAEIAARTAADTTLQTNIDAERTRALAAEAAITGGALSGGAGFAHIAGGNLIQWGAGTAAAGGTGAVTFPIAFPAACQSVQATLSANALNLTIRVASVSAASFTVFVEDTTNTGGKPSAFFWIACGR
jgi:hypothetical protein